MKISLNTIKKYVKIPDSVSNEELIELIGSRLVEIEDVIELKSKYQGAYIVKVVSAEPIPDTHLNLCRIDAGGVTAQFAQAGEDTIQIVCGAPNVRTGMLAVWLAPGTIVPSTYGNENFKLGARKLRGYESFGMLSGADELDFDTEHKSIAEIDPKIAQPGDTLIDVFELDDIILDVENKSLTHRPDCFGLIGFAREVAGILDIKFEEPELFQDIDVKIVAAGQEKVDVKIEDSELCPRYSCVVLDLPKHQPSRYLTRDAVFLAKAGMRAVDPIVDLTNILMLKTGQPLHAFDYDKLVQVGKTEDPIIIVRAAENGEKLQLLDSKTIECNPDDILITSNNVPVALAGAMGGKNTEIDASTTRIVLESATFSLYHLRKTQMAHGIFSEAITRFTKGQPAAITMLVLAEAVREIQVEPLAVTDEWVKKDRPDVIKITTDRINQLLGTSYDEELITRTLENVGFKVEKVLGNLAVTAPVWRTDIHIAEDVIEEVGRLLGYDNIPLTLPTKSFAVAEIDPLLRLKNEIRNILSDNLNMHELLTYSFVSRKLLEKVGMDANNGYEIVNSISPDLQCFRQQIVPSLLDKVRENLKAGYRAFDLYEMNQVSTKSSGLTKEGTPVTKMHLGIVGLSDFYTLKAKILALFKLLRINIEYTALSPESAQHDTYLEPRRAAEIMVNNQRIGVFGEMRGAVLRNFKLDGSVSALEINLDKLIEVTRSMQVDFKISKFPFVERDLTVQVASDLSFGRVLNALNIELSQQKLVYTIEPVSIYQTSPDDQVKNLSFHLKFSDPTKTLESTEISDIINSVVRGMSQVGATLI